TGATSGRRGSFWAGARSGDAQAFVGAAEAASFCLAPPPARQGEAGRGCPRFVLIQKAPLPNPPLPSQGREPSIAASAAPTVAHKQERPGLPGRFESPIPTCESPRSSRERRLHLLQRVRLDLADAFGGDTVLVGQFLQGDLVVVVQPAAPDDVARTLVQAVHAFAQQLQLVVLAVHALVSL